MSKVGEEFSKRLELAAPMLLVALKEIAEAKGRFSMDKLTHAENTIEDMVALANKAIALVEVIK